MMFTSTVAHCNLFKEENKNTSSLSIPGGPVTAEALIGIWKQTNTYNSINNDGMGTMVDTITIDTYIIEFKNDGTFTEKIATVQTNKADGSMVNKEYFYERGSWSVENGSLVKIPISSGNSKTSLEAAGSASTVYSPEDKNKYIYHTAVITDDHTKFAYTALSGGNTSTLEGTWGSLIEPQVEEYRFDIRSSDFVLSEKDFHQKVFTAGSTIKLNFIEAEYYGDFDNNGTNEFYTTPYYYSYDNSVYQTKEVVYGTTVNSWSLNKNKITLNFSDDVSSTVAVYIIGNALVHEGVLEKQ